jgi:hypothetical protein
MLRPGGYAQIVDPDRPLAEYDTAACAHCSAIIFTKPNSASTVYLIPTQTAGILHWVEEPGAACWSCGCQPVCLRCHALGTCTPLEKRLEQSEKGLGLLL